MLNPLVKLIHIDHGYKIIRHLEIFDWLVDKLGENEAVAALVYAEEIREKGISINHDGSTWIAREVCVIMNGWVVCPYDLDTECAELVGKSVVVLNPTEDY